MEPIMKRSKIEKLGLAITALLISTLAFGAYIHYATENSKKPRRVRPGYVKKIRIPLRPHQYP